MHRDWKHVFIFGISVLMVANNYGNKQSLLNAYQLLFISWWPALTFVALQCPLSSLQVILLAP
jgi:hypothetical protein